MKPIHHPKFLRGLLLIVAFMVNISAYPSSHTPPGHAMNEDLTHRAKTAILMVYFGSTHDDTRRLCLDAITEEVKKRFPDLEVREAFSSRIVIKKLKTRGILKHNPQEALWQLAIDGYENVIVQPTTMIDGMELISIRYDAIHNSKAFREVRISEPLLYRVQDYKRLLNFMDSQLGSGYTLLWVGHGTYHLSTAQYAMLDYMCMLDGHKQQLVGTVEGYPSFKEVLKRLKSIDAKHIRLQPLMLVAGDHAKNDIAVDWKEELEKHQYKVDTNLRGLGEYTEIREMILDKVQRTLRHKPVNIMSKKKRYQKTGEVDEH